MSASPVLFVGADPTGGIYEIPEELERIRKVLERDDNPFQLHSDIDLEPHELQQLLNQVRPHLFHFSGHFDESGSISLLDHRGEEKRISKDVFLQVLAQHTGSIRCAFLNACFGDSLGRELADMVGVAVAMEGLVSVETALVFAQRFYDALAWGRTVREAFDQGRLELDLLGVTTTGAGPLIFEREPGLAAATTFARREPAMQARTAGTAGPKPGVGPGAGDIFISYAHEDREWLEKIAVMLKPVVRDRGIVAWDDRSIAPSDDWSEKIDEALSRARAAILLVSPEFLASDFISTRELPVIMDAWKADRVKVLWIYLKPCFYDLAGLEPVQAAHRPLEPLIALDGAGRYAALHQAALAVRETLESVSRG